MQKTLLLCSLVLFSIVVCRAQNTRDTSIYPYWIKMMQDPNVNFYKTQRAFELYWQNRPIEKGSGWKAFKRWEWLSSKLIDSLGNFPDANLQLQGHMFQIEQDELYWNNALPGLGAGTVSCKVQGDWKPMGPTQLPTNNTGQINGMGRINAIAIHPTDSNTIFVGSAAGGIWKTTNGGQTWSVNTDSLPTLGVSAIAINPSNASIMYFGSGDRDAGDASGFGVFKSTNSGATWSISNTGMGSRTVARLIIDPNNPSILLAACNGGIYRSTNAGASWTQTFTGGFFKDIIFKPNNSNVVYATNAGLLYRSLDNGVNWSSITTGLPTSSISRAVIDVNAINPSLVYVWIANGSVNRGFYLSRDSGSTFRTQSTTPNIHDYSTNGSGSGGQAWYNMDMVTDPTNQAIVYCGGVNVFRSNDTGRTWTIAGYWVNQIHADQHELIRCNITNKIYAGNDGGLYSTRNRGVSWTPLKSGLGIAQIYKLDASRTVKDILINGYQDNGTGNYNEGWYTTRGGDGMDCEIDQTDSRYSYGELYYGNIFRVYNVNVQATIAQQGYIAAGSDTINESGDWVTPITLKEGSGNTMYVGYKNIWRSNNIRSNPVTWRKISNNLGGSNAFNFTEIENCISNPDILYASRSNGTFYRSDDVNAATPTWNAITQPVSGVINAIETDPTNQNIVYIGIGGRVYRSTNKGSSWTQVASNFSYTVAAVLLDTSNKKKGIYVGTMGGGVWYTDTTINTWRYFNKGLPNTVRVTDLAMYYEPNEDCNCNVLYGSTYNRGNWFTTIYNDGSQKPVALLEKYDTIICSSSTIAFKDKSCNSPGRFKWAFTPSNVSFINGTDTMTANANVSFGSKGRYGFKFMAENCIGIDTLEGYVIVGDTVRTACIPTTTNNFNGLGIYDVSIGNLSRISGGRTQEGSYVDVSCSKIVKVIRGSKYVLRVTTGALNTEQVKAFIDYNNDGDFADAGELVYQPAPAMPNHADTITIPMNATTDKILRMRIRSDYLTLGTNPCSNLNYGQTEDYGLYIEGDKINAKFVVDKPSICEGITVVYTDSSSPSGNTYSWNFGSGASPSTASTKGPHLVKYSSPGYKTVSLEVDGAEYIKDSAVLVYIRPNISISIPVGDSSICLKKPFTLRANDSKNSSANYQWYLNSTIKTDSTFTSFRRSISTYSDSGLYSIIANTGQCSDTAFQRIRIRHLPSSNFVINDSNQCLKSNAFTYTNSSSISSGSLSHVWSYGDGFNTNTLNASRTYIYTGVLSVKLVSTSNYGCKDSISKTIIINGNPLSGFTVTPSSQCFRSNLFSFTNSSFINTGSLTYAWNFGDGNTSTSTIPSAKTYSIYDTSYRISLIATSSDGCSDTSIRNVKLFAQPAAGFTINNSAQCLSGNQFTFTNSGQISNGTYTSRWLFGDANQSSSVNPSHTYASAGQYTVKQILTSNNGCSDTADMLLETYHQPKTNFTINDSTQCLKGNSFSFNNTSSISSGTISNKWVFSDGSSSTNLNESKIFSTNGTYIIKLISTSNNLCKDSISKTLLVYPQTAIDFNINTSKQCFKGHQFIFSNASTITSGSFNSTINFGDNSILAFNSNANKTYSTFADSFIVQMIATSNFNCKDSLSKTVYLNPSPYPSFTINDSIQCEKENQFTYSNSSITDKGSIQNLWFFGDGNTSNSKDPSHKYSTTGIHTVNLKVIANGGCSDSISKQIIINLSPFAIIDGLYFESCLLNNNLTFKDIGNSYTGMSYSWNFGDGNSSMDDDQTSHSYTNSGIYTVTLIKNTVENCKDTSTATAEVFENPNADFTINDNEQCLIGNQYTMTDQTVFAGGYSRKWYLPQLASSIASTISNSFSDTGMQIISLLIESNDGCKDSISKVVFTRPMPNFTVNGPKKACLNDTILFTTLSSEILNYSWKVDNGNTILASQINLNTSQVGTKNIEVAAINTFGCVTTIDLNPAIIIHGLPVVDFDYSSQAFGNGAELTLIDKGNYPVLQRSWYTYNSLQGTNLFIGSNQTEKYQIDDTGTYTIQLYVTDTNSCKAMIEKTIFMKIPNKYFLPDAFTPNGDLINETFGLSGYLQMQEFNMRIYGRWGEILFESNDPKIGWDGRFENEFVPVGYYMYTVYIKDLYGEIVELKGMVLLIR